MMHREGREVVWLQLCEYLCGVPRNCMDTVCSVLSCGRNRDGRVQIHRGDLPLVLVTFASGDAGGVACCGCAFARTPQSAGARSPHLICVLLEGSVPCHTTAEHIRRASCCSHRTQAQASTQVAWHRRRTSRSTACSRTTAPGDSTKPRSSGKEIGSGCALQVTRVRYLPASNLA